MSKSTSSKFGAVRIIILAGIVLLLVSIMGWWRMIYSDPGNVFDRMIANSLASPAVTKTIEQDDETQQLDQTTSLQTQPEQFVQSISTLTQTGDAETTIVTESIGTPKVDFVRYSDIQTDQKSISGKAFDFSAVIGTWGKTDDSNPEAGGAQLFNQTVLGVVPVANVRQPYRKMLEESIKKDNVYAIDTSQVKRQTVNGRPVYSYDVTVAPVAYVTMLKNFARSIGITRLNDVDPSQYANSAPLKFVFDIDVWSGQLIKVAYDGSARTEAYSGYGAQTQIELPNSSIDVNELQARLQQIQ